MHLTPLPADAPRRLLLGFSGGRDSTALLHRLATARDPPWLAVRAVHVDHGLHPEAAAWAEHCRRICEAQGVALSIHRVQVLRRREGLEAAARAARFAAYAAERRKDECLVLAHHREDQAETLLLALLRGSGERGLAAMRAFTSDRRGPIWRPLLDTPAATVASYAREQGLRWIEDPANVDTRISRNALRHAVLPLLRRRWPQADAALARSAALLAEADALLEAQAQADLSPLLGLDPAVLDLAALRALPPERARRALRAWAALNNAALSSDTLERVSGEWRDAAPSRALRHALGPHWLRQWQGRLWLTSRTSMAPRPAREWDGRSPLALADGGELRLLGAANFDAPLRLVARSQAPARIRPDPRRPARSLRAILATGDLPPWQRDKVPLLVDAGGQLAAIADLAYSADFAAWLRARGARLLWCPGASIG